MGLVVQHNLTAMNANRQLGVISSAQGKATEKLSSGYRINRAGDDAAGLTISEKMRSQVRGLNRASTNAQDGISLIQSAEGALNEAHSILQRMNELAVQGANDTNETIDREAINKELNQLTEELDRISQTTQFNKQNLLDGTFKDKNLHVGANANQKIAISIDNMNAASLGLKSIKITQIQTGKAPTKISYNGEDIAISDGETVASAQLKAVSDFQGTISDTAKSTQYAKQYDDKTGSVYYIDIAGSRYVTASAAMDKDVTIAKSVVKEAILSHFSDYVTIGDTKGDAATVGVKSSGKANVDNYESANATITAIQNAINKVSNQRSELGAIQNRLEHTVANLDTVAENTAAAESRIRDTDMASMMVEYSKNNILAQAGQSMLAQANQSTQGVLSLLQ